MAVATQRSTWPINMRFIYRSGADILDIGGQSTRPGYEEVSPQVEADRVLPLIKIRETL